MIFLDLIRNAKRVETLFTAMYGTSIIATQGFAWIYLPCIKHALLRLKELSERRLMSVMGP